jgi:hypothetical protein
MTNPSSSKSRPPKLSITPRASEEVGATPPQTSTRPTLPSTPLKSVDTPEGITREKLKEDMAQDLEYHCWECPVTSFIKFFFPNFEEKTFESVQNELPLLNSKEHKLSYRDYKKEMLEKREEWPEGGPESRFYSPLCYLLEEIRLAFEAVKKVETLFKFHVYTREMGDRIGGMKALKPDLLGLYGTVSPDEHILWSRPVITGEVNAEWPRMLAQGGTHARSMLYGRPNRHVAWLLLFNHKENKARLCAYHRGGVTSTKQMEISRKEGYKDMVRVMVAFLCTENLQTIGEDSTRDAGGMILPNGQPAQIKEILFQR